MKNFKEYIEDTMLNESLNRTSVSGKANVTAQTSYFEIELKFRDAPNIKFVCDNSGKIEVELESYDKAWDANAWGRMVNDYLKASENLKKYIVKGTDEDSVYAAIREYGLDAAFTVSVK